MRKLTSIDRTTLIVCRSIDEVRLLKRIKQQPNSRYVLASDDIRVHKAIDKYPWIEEVCFIEKMESFYNVVEDVIKYLEIINEWLKSLADEKRGIPKELLFWVRHCEGGMTTQRIQDLLLLIRSYIHLFDTHKITSVIILSYPGMQWEDDVLVQVAKSRDIPVTMIGSYRFSVLFGKVWNWFGVYVRAVYYMVNSLRLKFRNYCILTKKKIVKREIIFQLCSSAYKHVENIVPLMKALQDIGYEPIALCWHSSERYKKETGADQVRIEGLRADELEAMLHISTWLFTPYLIFRTWKRTRRSRKVFWMHPKLSYFSVPIGKLLWPSIRYFIVAELTLRILLWQAAKKYFEDHKPLAAKLWGNGVLYEGDILAKLLKSRNIVIFAYFVGLYTSNPYSAKELGCIIDLFLATGSAEKIFLMEEYAAPPERVVMIGKGRYDQVTVFQKNYSKEYSRYYLGLNSTYTIYLLYDPGTILRGYCSVTENVQVTWSLLDFARRNSSAALLIKPHPSHKSGPLEELIHDFSLRNVYLLDKAMLPYHAINAADLVITKFSTIGIESMLFGKPVVSVILDREGRFRVYGDTVAYINSLDILNQFLYELFKDEQFREKWVKNQVSRQNIFCKEYFFPGEFSPNVLAAKAIDRKIAKRNS